MAFDLVAAYAQSDAPFFVSGQSAATLNEAPQQITLKFSPGIKIDASSLKANISVVRSGGAGDGFGNAGSKADVPVVPGSITVDDLPNENQVVIRFAETLPDDTYRITVGAGLKTTANDTATPRSIDFRLDLGAFVMSVVPQPVTRTGTVLSQDRNAIEVYFNANDPLNVGSAQKASSYRLFEVNSSTGDDVNPLAPVNPTAVSYDPASGKAVLTFADVLGGKLYRLQIGAAETLVGPASEALEGSAANSSFATAKDLGALGVAGAKINGAINVKANVSTPAGSLEFPSQPGSVDEPGHRDTPSDSGMHGDSALTVGPAGAIQVQEYNFKEFYGFDPQGNALRNGITETQKQRAREVFELFSRYTGIRFVETATSGITVVTGDMRAIEPTISTAPAGLAGPGMAIMDATDNWGESEYGGSWFQVAMHEIGHVLGLEHSYDLPSIMGKALPGENVFPGDYDTVHLAQFYPANGSDIDVYKFSLASDGKLSAETVVARPGQPATSTLDSLLTLYREVGGKREMIARNDDFYGRDSFIGLDLAAKDGSGNTYTYYIAVTSTGNDKFNPEVNDSGYGGRSDGAYQLKLGFKSASVSATTIVDTSGMQLDGDRDGKAGGAFNFWFNTASPADTVFVDKTAAAGGNGSIGTPYDTIKAAIDNIGSKKIIRIAGNSTDTPYLVGIAPSGRELPDGATFNVPAGVTVMIDAGAILKLRAAVIDVGSSSKIVSRAGASLQVLGTPGKAVTLTSYHDDDIGGNSDGTGPGRDKWAGSWGGVVLRADSDSPSKQAFVNSIAGAAIRYGGGQVLIDSVLDSYAPIQLESTRPTIAFNTITNSAGAAISADPNSFEDSNGRVGPEIRGNKLVEVRKNSQTQLDEFHQNSINGLFLKIRTNFGSPVDTLDVPARFRSTDIVYVLQENLLISGGAGGYESRSDRTGSISISSRQITGLPRTSDLRVGMAVEGDGIPAGTVIASIDNNTTVTLSAQPTKTATNVKLFFTFARLSGRLAIDPGVVVKLQNSRIELGRGTSQLVAEGTAGQRVVFTSLGDNRFGAGGTFDTNGNLLDVRRSGDWGGIVLNAGAKASIDNSYLAFGGGQTPVEGGFATFNVIEVHQGDLRIAHSRIEKNEAGSPTANPTDNRVGRGTNGQATIFVRGAQPVILGNDFRDNLGAIVSINANSLTDAEQPDAGRSTGFIDRDTRYDDNFGALVRDNRLSYSATDGGAMLGMRVRGEEITVQSVWDDADIVQVLQDEIIVRNFHTATGVRLVSQPNASLIVKLAGTNAGFTADGYGLDIDDRIGGTVQVVGQPGYPVILTSLKDDSVGVSIDPLGVTVKDINTDGAKSTAAAGDWRSLKFLPLSNDRNVSVEPERELGAIAGTDTNSAIATAQALGVLAPNLKSGDDNRRLGFQVQGRIAIDNPGDVDVYSFNGTAGTEVWIDIDKTSSVLDVMVELLDASGSVLALSADSQTDAALATAKPGIRGSGQSLQKNSFLGGDYWSVNPKDSGMRVVLPGSAGQQSQYYIRVRSQPRYDGSTSSTQHADALTDQTKLAAGPTSGRYQLNVRLQQRDEVPGSTVRYADIRYPTIGIDVQGLPNHSPLTSEAGENRNDTTNDTTPNPRASSQYVGNLLKADQNTISISGTMAGAGDVDWYTFALNYEEIQSIRGLNDGLKTWATVFDIDYGSGFRGDLTLSVFDENGNLLYVGRDSNVNSDQPNTATTGSADSDLSRGSFGKLDPFIGSVQMPTGNPTGSGNAQLRYYVAVSSNERLPAALDATFKSSATSALVRLEPVNSITRLVEDHIGFTGYTTGSLPKLPVKPAMTNPLIDVSSTLQLSTNVTPFTLSDVTLFVTNGFSLRTVDAMRGGTETRIVDTYGFSNKLIQDIAMRSDGELYSYSSLVDGANTAGQLDLVNSGTGALTLVGNDSIPDPPPADPFSDVNLAPKETVIRAGVTTFTLSRPGIDPEQLSGSIQYSETFVGTTLNGQWNFAPKTGGGFTVTTISQPPGLPGVELVTFDRDTSTITVKWTGGTVLVQGVSLSATYRLAANPEALKTDLVDAVAWYRKPLGGYDLIYSVRDAAQSRLYKGNPTTGAIVGDGRVGTWVQDTGNNIGIVTGLAAVNGKLYGVDNKGNFFSMNQALLEPKFDSAAATIIKTHAITFAGLTEGPKNLQDGFFSNKVFAIDQNGQLYCLDTAGNLQTVFDANGDGIPDATSIWSGTSSATGLAFSPLDINLWHPTTRRGTDAGHGINAALDNTRDGQAFRSVSDGQNVSREHAEGEGGVSMYFGLERYVKPVTPTPYLNYQSLHGQYGVRSTTWQEDLSNNPDIPHTYNLPGGAYGSLTTNAFSLAAYGYTDKPTLYFNYFLQTQGASSAYNRSDMRDSARVFVSTNGGLSWDVIATNNSTRSELDTALGELPNFPSASSAMASVSNQHVQELFDTGNWRQARIDLGKYVGNPDIRLRFDFSTAGEMDPTARNAAGALSNNINGYAGTTGDFSGSNSVERGQNNKFEGFYIDDIIVGFAERGEMVTGTSPNQTGFFDTQTPKSFTTGDQILEGAYQLEIRRGSEYGMNPSRSKSDVLITRTFDPGQDFVAAAGSYTDDKGSTRFYQGDANTPRAQGQFLIDGNIISDAKQYGISIDSGVRDGGTNAPNQGVAQSFRNPSASRLVPGVVVTNNVISTSGTAGILFSGDPNTGNAPLAAVPYGRIINNTIYGGPTAAGVGVQVTENAGPTILNNLFANLATGVSVDESSQPQTVIGGSAYHVVNTPVTGGTQSQQIPLTSNPFVDAAKRNFYLAAKSDAIDSSVNALADRSAMVDVTSPLGIPQSPIIAPDRDLYGQLRRDDPSQANANTPGLGSNVFKDRGAIDRVDFAQPFAAIAVPVDDGADDENKTPDAVRLVRAAARGVTRFELQLNDNGVGIDKSKVNTSAFVLQRGNNTMQNGVDYVFRYLENTNRVIFESAAVFPLGNYTVTVAQAAGNNVITDLAANPLLGNQADGTAKFTIELADVPGAPVNVAGTPGDRQVSVSWAEPFANGSAITDYEIQYSTDNGANWITFSDGTSPATSTIVTGLVNRTAYVFRVRALNALGPSGYSSASSPVTPQAPASAPAITSVLAGDSQATLNWTVPLDDGGSAISDYIVQFRTDVDNSNWQTFPDKNNTDTFTTVIDLTNGISYRFRVAAFTGAGTGTFSAESNPVTPLAAPGAPTGLTGTWANQQVNLTWTAPANTGGRPITDYVVQFRTDVAGSTWLTAGDGVSSNPTSIVTGLTNGTAYRFQVAAVTDFAQGAFSAPSAAITPRTFATAPAITSVSAGDQSVTLNWATPVDNGGSEITGYAVEHSSNGGATWTRTFVDDGNTETVTGLGNGVTYILRVAAVNGVGVGPFSAPTTQVIPLGTPTEVGAVPSDRSAWVAWTPPTGNSAAIVGYRIEVSSNGGGTWTVAANVAGNSTSARVTGLTNGVAYVFRVAAVSSQGAGGFSDESAPATPAPGAVAPTRLSAAPSNGAVTLRWTAPRVPRGMRITDYVVQYSSDNGASWRVYQDAISSAAQAVVTGLTNGTTYRFRVAAVTGDVVGAASAMSNAVTPFDRNAKPAAPTNLSGFFLGSGRYSLTWNAVAGNAGGPVTDYVIQYRINSARGSRWVTFKDPVSAATSATLTRLTNRTGYVFRVAAKNLAGIGAYSAEVLVQERLRW